MFNYIGFSLIWTSIRNIIKSFFECGSNVLPLIYVGGGGKYFLKNLIINMFPCRVFEPSFLMLN